MDWLIFTACVLAVFRLSTLFSEESGPGRIFQKLRRVPKAGSSAREGLSCPLCLSVTFAAMATGFLYWQDKIELPWTIFWWMAISGGSVAITPLHLLIAKK